MILALTETGEKHSTGEPHRPAGRGGKRMELKADTNQGSSIMRKVNDSIIYNLTARRETSGRIPGMVPDMSFNYKGKAMAFIFPGQQ
ncbi:MAG: hypothetical protein KA821_18680 [Chitinophagaceae bacterium]|nr:hypothetical protein [Chitinophagaceae bacterium]